MKDAKSLLLEALAAIPDGEKVALRLAEDGVVDLPFLHLAKKAFLALKCRKICLLALASQLWNV